MPAKPHYIIVFVTTGSSEEAGKIAHALVTEKLAACCNVMDSIRSIYTWENKLCDERECLMIIKTQRKLFDHVAARIKSLHSYKTPEIIAVPITTGSNSYLDWILQNTSKS